MTKIKLTLENLRVESFATCAAESEHGTVFGRAEIVAVTEQVTRCAPECETWAGVGACSVNDGCASSPFEITGPCSNCVETDHLCTMNEICVIEVLVPEG
jgi:hypothetical protein